MCYLSYTDTSKGGGHKVVYCRRLYLATEFPHQRAAKGIRCRLPEVQTVAACRIEIEIAVIGMGKEVGGELVVVPHEAFLKILVYGMHVYLGKVFTHNETVEAMHEDIYSCCLVGGNPRMFLSTIIVHCDIFALVADICQRHISRA